MRTLARFVLWGAVSCALAACGGLTAEQIQTVLRTTRSFADKDLRGLDLAGLDLRGVDFREADLARANLDRANLDGALLMRAELENASLVRASLRGANLAGAEMDGANLTEASVMGALLSGADLEGVTFDRANLAGAVLSGADLKNASLREANLELADLYRANLKGTDLEGARFAGAYVFGALNIEKARNADKALGMDEAVRTVRPESLATDAAFERANYECRRDTVMVPYSPWGVIGAIERAGQQRRLYEDCIKARGY